MLCWKIRKNRDAPDEETRRSDIDLRDATAPRRRTALRAHLPPSPHLFAAAAFARSKPSVLRLVRAVAHRLSLARRLCQPSEKMISIDMGQLLLHLGVLGAGVLSGLYFIFSFCVMQSLDAQPAASAIATMNSINVVIVNPLFILFFMGTPIVCAVLLWSCLRDSLGSSADNTLTAAGALTLLLGEFVLTLAIHIPKNNALAAYASLGSASDAATWAKYYTTWTQWNHVRMLASMITVVLLSSATHLRGARLATMIVRPTQI